MLAKRIAVLCESYSSLVDGSPMAFTPEARSHEVVNIKCRTFRSPIGCPFLSERQSYQTSLFAKMSGFLCFFATGLFLTSHSLATLPGFKCLRDRLPVHTTLSCLCKASRCKSGGHLPTCQSVEGDIARRDLLNIQSQVEKTLAITSFLYVVSGTFVSKPPHASLQTAAALSMRMGTIASTYQACTLRRR